MNIVINTIPLLEQLTGIGRYTYEVSRRVAGTDRHRYVYYYGYFSHKLLLRPHVASWKKIRGAGRVMRLFSTLRERIFPERFDLYWEPNFIPLPELEATCRVVTVHDLSSLLYPEWHPKDRVEYFAKHFVKSLATVDHFIAVSDFTKKEMVHHLGIAEEKISVIYNGIDHSLYRRHSEESLNATRTKLKLPRRFILFVGSIEPRKNLVTLLKAYRLLPESLKNDVSLVLAGFKGWENREILSLIDSEKERIRYLGYLSESQLSHLYNLAELFVYPSLYEGFGIPVLEAMACGTPVITSEGSSLSEVGGEAVRYIDPKSERSIREAMERLLTDRALREELSRRGLARAKLFDWDVSARRHRELFESLWDGRKRTEKRFGRHSSQEDGEK